MPCRNGFDGDYHDDRRIVYVNQDNPEDKMTIEILTEQNKRLEASLCAIISELEQRNLAHDILFQASKKGMIDLYSFWKHHSGEDEIRLQSELMKFSEHEQSVLKRLLNKKSE